MTVFIFPRINLLTDHWHPEGGAVVIAESLEQAVAMLRERGGSPTDEEIGKVEFHPLAGAAMPKVFIFPDAGCC